MKNVALFNALLWILNVLIIGGIVAFACLYLLFPPQEDLFKDVSAEPPGGGKTSPQSKRTDHSYVRNLANPLLPESIARSDSRPVNELDRIAKFLGGYRIADREDSDVAFLEVLANKSYANAYKGQPINLYNKPLPELHGWTLVRLTENGALFTNGQKEVELKRGSAVSTATSAPGTRPGHPSGLPGSFDWRQSNSKRVRGDGNNEEWSIDRNEANYVDINYEQLVNGVELSDYSGGGIKINAAGEYAGERGFMDGDVIKHVNGQPVSQATLPNIMEKLKSQNTNVVNITLDRAGKPFTLRFTLAR